MLKGPPSVVFRCVVPPVALKNTLVMPPGNCETAVPPSTSVDQFAVLDQAPSGIARPPGVGRIDGRHHDLFGRAARRLQREAITARGGSQRQIAQARGRGEGQQVVGARGDRPEGRAGWPHPRREPPPRGRRRRRSSRAGPADFEVQGHRGPVLPPSVRAFVAAEVRLRVPMAPLTRSCWPGWRPKRRRSRPPSPPIRPVPPRLAPPATLSEEFASCRLDNQAPGVDGGCACIAIAAGQRQGAVLPIFRAAPPLTAPPMLTALPCVSMVAVTAPPPRLMLRAEFIATAPPVSVALPLKFRLPDDRPNWLSLEINNVPALRFVPPL